jgi:myo-inositol-1(or 4)-monophosphatase
MDAIAAVAERMMRDGLSGDLEVASKGHPSDLVTRVDRDIEARARELVAASLPGHGFLGEEGGGEAARSGWLWVVDPLDGTANYANGIQHAAASIGLCYAGRPVAGLVADPFRGERFLTGGDGPPTCNGQPVGLRPQAGFDGGVVLLEMGGRMDPPAAALGLFQRVRQAGGVCRVMGSAALSLAYVAAGRAAATLMLRVSAWDVAAGVALVAAAGGIAVRAWDGAPYDVLEAGPLVAGSPRAVDTLRRLLAEG